MPEHNLDQGVEEYFDFILKGHKYRFRHFNTDEMEEMQKLGKDDKKARAFLYKAITKLDEDAPDFPDTAKEMTVPHWRRFWEMIKEEMSVADIQGQK